MAKNLEKFFADEYTKTWIGLEGGVFQPGQMRKISQLAFKMVSGEW